MTDTMGDALKRFEAQRRAEREKLIRAMAEHGRAGGLEAGAKILRALAQRGASPSELRAAAASMEATAEAARAKADAEIAAAGGKA